MKIRIISENIRHENDGKRTIVELKGHCFINDPREIRELVAEGDYVGIGVSNCHPDDTPDIYLGKRIARARAYSNLFSTIRDVHYKKLTAWYNRFMITQNSVDKYGIYSVLSQRSEILRLTTGSPILEDYPSFEERYCDEDPDERFCDIVLIPIKPRDFNHTRYIKNILKKEKINAVLELTYEDDFIDRIEEANSIGDPFKWVLTVTRSNQSNNTVGVGRLNEDGSYVFINSEILVNDLPDLIKSGKLDKMADEENRKYQN